VIVGIPEQVLRISLSSMITTQVMKKRLTFRHETIHHPLNKLNLVLDRKVDEVRIDEYPEGRAEVVIVGEKESEQWT